MPFYVNGVAGLEFFPVMGIFANASARSSGT